MKAILHVQISRLVAGVVVAILALAACSDGTNDRTRTQLAATISSNDASTSAVVTSLTKVSETRYDRTQYDYAFSVTLKNGSTALVNPTATITSTGPGVTVIHGTASFKSVAANDTVVSTDTIILRVNRTLSFDPASIRWDIQSENNPGVPSSSTTSTVTVDSSVPQAASATIKHVMSTAGSGAPGSGIPIPTAAGGQTLVVGVDANNHIMLASMAGSNSTVLSADSTALALVRILLGALPPSANPDQVNAAIRATSEYPRLLSLITNALSAGTPPSTVPAIFESLNTVVSQISPTVINAVAAKNKAMILSAAVASPSVTTPTPYYLLKPTGSIYQSVFVTGSTTLTSGNVNVVNNTSIAWSIASKDTNGARLPSGCTTTLSNPDCSVLLKSAGVFSQLANGTVPNSLLATTIPGNGNAFNITLEQTQESKTANVINVTTDFINFIIAASTAGTAAPVLGCSSGVVNQLLPPQQVASIVAQPNADAMMNYLRALPTFGLGKALYACFPSKSSNVANADTFAGAVLDFLIGFGTAVGSSLNSLANTANVGVEIGMIYGYWHFTPSTFGVCEATPPLGLVPQIANCAAAFRFSPSTQSLPPTRQATATITAYDADGEVTLLPDNITYQVINESNPGVIFVDPKKGTVKSTVLPPGITSVTATILATDQSTGISASYLVTVALKTPTVTVTTTPANTSAGSVVTLTASVYGSVTDVAATGTVTFSDSKGILCSSTLINGSASCSSTISALPDTVTAQYDGGDHTYYTAASNGTVIASSQQVYSPGGMFPSIYGICAVASYRGPVGDIYYTGVSTIDSGSYTLDAYGVCRSLHIVGQDTSGKSVTVDVNQTYHFDAMGRVDARDWEASWSGRSYYYKESASYADNANGTSTVSITETTNNGSGQPYTYPAQNLSVLPNVLPSPAGSYKAGTYTWNGATWVGP